MPTLDITIRHRFSPSFALDIAYRTESTHIGITGPSGSGKTSILHAIAGIFRPDHAHIVLNDACFADSEEWCAPRHRRVGLVTQDALLYPHLNVAENLGFGVHAGPEISNTDAVVDMLEIGPLMRRRTRHLSGGERQRVALGRALLSMPDTLLLDEPFCAIDPERRARIVLNLQAYLSTTPTSLLMASHDQEVVQRLCSVQINVVEGSNKK